jgi:hypothetical protein
MSLPASEPLPPDDFETLPPARRRRRKRQSLLPDFSGEHAQELNELTQQLTPTLEYFFLAFLAGLAIGVAALLNSPALFVLAALVAPFLTPVVGLALSVLIGSWRSFSQYLGATGVGSLLTFLGAALVGWTARFWKGLPYDQALLHAHFSWTDSVLLVAGGAAVTLLLLRSTDERPRVAGVALSYGLLLPAGIAGFGLTGGLEGLFPDALVVFVSHLSWAALTAALVLVALGIRPMNNVAYALGVGLILLSIAALVAVTGLQLPKPGEPGVAAESSRTPPAASMLPGKTIAASKTSQAAPLLVTRTVLTSPGTPGPSQTPTNTLVPTNTPTTTVSPAPTPVWGKIRASDGNGAVVRAEPDYNALYVTSLLNGALVEILPESTMVKGTTWVKIRANNNIEGWIVRGLLVTATPGAAVMETNTVTPSAN